MANHPNAEKYYQVRVTEAHGPHKEGDLLKVWTFGTLGCKDDKGNWVDFYKIKITKTGW